MRVFMISCGLIFGLLLAGIRPAAACGNGRVIFEDKFATLDPSWGFDDDNPQRKNGPSGLTYTLPPSTNIDLLNQAGLNENYEVCAVFEIEAPKEEALTYGGLTFWATDRDNEYQVDVAPAIGKYAFYRMQRGKFLTPIPWHASSAIVSGLKSKNEVSIAVKDNKATLSINGKKVFDFTGQPPEGGSVFGFNLGSTKEDEKSVITLKSIQLRELENAQQ